MFKQLLFLCSFILFQATLSQAQVIDFFNAASITIWGDDFDISRINSHSQEDRTYNGKKNGVDKLDINFHNGSFIQALSIPNNTPDDIVKKTY